MIIKRFLLKKGKNTEGYAFSKSKKIDVKFSVVGEILLVYFGVLIQKNKRNDV
jgi:hypothetical protein